MICWYNIDVFFFSRNTLSIHINPYSYPLFLKYLKLKIQFNYIKLRSDMFPFIIKYIHNTIKIQVPETLNIIWIRKISEKGRSAAQNTFHGVQIWAFGLEKGRFAAQDRLHEALMGGLWPPKGPLRGPYINSQRTQFNILYTIYLHL